MNQPAALSATPLTGNQTSSVADLINQIVAALGASFTIPTDTNSDEFLDNLRQLRDKVDALAESETDPMRHTASLDEDPSVETLQSRLDEVTRQLALERRRSREDRAKHFESAVDRLIGDGRVSPADKPSLLATGDIANYSLSLLAPFQRIPLGAAVPTRPVARRSATAHPPNILPDTPIDDERARRIANDFAP